MSFQNQRHRRLRLAAKGLVNIKNCRRSQLGGSDTVVSMSRPHTMHGSINKYGIYYLLWVHGTICIFCVPYLFNLWNYHPEYVNIVRIYQVKINFISFIEIINVAPLFAIIHAMYFIVFTSTCSTVRIYWPFKVLFILSSAHCDIPYCSYNSDDPNKSNPTPR